ncbi:MAG: 5'-nucleotidase C-terminal domain-containing protein [Bacillota bacterium]|nr:5'-nucleotidase C-terminal domain-containing protein [Bacillota bacterium]
MKKRITAFLMALLVLFSAVPVFGANEARTVRICYTHDVHSHLDQVPKLYTALHEASLGLDSTNCIYVDGGDFSQGTLFQAGYETGAYEYGVLSLLGCSAAAIGNHEWDHAGEGFAKMINSARERYAPLPPLLAANLNFEGELTEEQKAVKDALDSIGPHDYTIIESSNGLKIGVFGLSGDESIADSPTSGMVWKNYISTAKSVASELKNKCDVIICLSHCGTNGDGKTGEDFDLAAEVPEIDMIVSAHSHTAYAEPIFAGNTLIASAGCYLENMGFVDITVNAFGDVSFSNYTLVELNDNVQDSLLVKQFIDGYKTDINNTYLAEYGYEYNQKIAHCSFDFMSLDDMYATHQEYPMGNLIADSYIYEARKNGINDIDVALVGLGTIRGSFTEGDITTSDAFDICSLGAGKDGSAGHPLLTAYITGKELKLLTELDASLGPMVSSIKMSYSGLRYTFNTKRMILDRVTKVGLHDEFGFKEDSEIEDDKLYKVCCNMYAANMLGMLNGLTKGLLSIVPKDANGNPIEDFYDCEMLTEDGKEIKEWYAFADYLHEIEEIPDAYKKEQGRKVKIAQGDIESIIEHPGLATWIALAAIILVLLILFLIIKLIIRIIKK